MKKISRILIIFLILMIGYAFKNNKIIAKEKEVKTIEIGKNMTLVKSGEYIELSDWTVQNNEILEISGSKHEIIATGKNAGETTVSYKQTPKEGASFKTEINVKVIKSKEDTNTNKSLETIETIKKSVNIKIGDECEVKLSHAGSTSYDVEFVPSNEKIAKINNKKNNGYVISGISYGEATIEVNESWQLAGTSMKQKTIYYITVRKPAEVTEKENYDTSYNGDPNKLTNGADRITYLRSVIYNDDKNKNDNLWKSFVNKTSPETRKNWYDSIAMFRDTDEVRDVLKVLEAYIKIDNATTESEKNDAMNQFNNIYSNAGKEQENKYNQLLIKIISGSKGESRNQTVFTNDVLDDPSAYNPTDPSSDDDSEAATIIDKILSLITTIGTVISVLMLAILGVKYMLGSVEEKADYKKDLVPYFIGAALLFGICTIVKILQSLGSTINNL